MEEIKKKYTEEFVLAELQLLLTTLKENKDIVYIGELFEDKDYSRQRFSEWISEPNEKDRASRYGDNEEIKRLSATIKEILESRAVKGAITNKLNPTFTIFHLKNNYKENWKDKTEVDNNNTNVEVTETLSPEQKAKIAKRFSV